MVTHRVAGTSRTRPAPPPPLGLGPAPADEPVQILLIDDQPASLVALEATLAATGCRFVTARTPDEALLALLDRDFAAIVLDVVMPTMSGFELAAMIRRRQRTVHMPILFLTAHLPEREHELRGYAVGAVDYLTKPVAPEILRAKLGVFVELYRKRRALLRANVELQRQIAERQRMAEALRTANEELEARVAQRTAALAESNRRKDEFLAILAHELRTPLSALWSATEALRLPAPRAELATLQGVVERQLRQLMRLTDDLLDLNRVNRGKLRLQRQPLELAQVIHAAVETTRPLIEQHGHTVTIHLPHKPLRIDGDAARLAQVFANLLDNAARYTEPGGHIQLSADTADGYAQVKVEDTGRGIDRELLPRVFEPFTQGGPPGESGGLGIGLPLARQLLEMHGGSIAAYSAGPGRGAELIVRLPLLAEPAEREGAGAGGQLPRTLQPDRRVLIVEDDHESAATLSVMLTNWGQQTRVAHDGVAALVAAEQFRPDIVLLDVGLPRLHGHEVARRLREQPWGKHVLVIAITGWGLPHDRQGEAAGIDHRLLKPIDPEVLRELLVNVQRAGARVS